MEPEVCKHGSDSSELEEAESRISFFFFQFFQWRLERKDFLLTQLDSRRMCISGSILSGTSFWRWLVRQEVRRESSKGETASVQCGSSPGVMLVIIQVVCHSFTCFICPSLDSSALGLVFCRLYLWWDTTNGEKLTAFFSNSFLNDPGLTWMCLKFRLCSSCFPTQYLCFSEYS